MNALELTPISEAEREHIRRGIRLHLSRANKPSIAVNAATNQGQYAMTSFIVYVNGRKVERLYSLQSDPVKVKQELLAKGYSRGIDVQREQTKRNAPA